MTILSWERLLSDEKIVEKKREEPAASDWRSLFEKDYHRIVISSSFRRLQGKAQVFPLEKFDFVRTRLTHSIEVASVARSLGKYLVKDLEAINETCSKIQYIPNILECAGLIHDIGNPPFGHFGECAIQDWFSKNLPMLIFMDDHWAISNDLRIPSDNNSIMNNLLSEQQKMDFVNFEGNAQSLRNVMKLNYVIDENGFNLTFALLNTLIKYPTNSTKISNNKLSTKKMGYFYSENDEFSKITDSTGVKYGDTVFRHPLTFLLEAADDITYLADDIEDGIHKHKLRIDDVYTLLSKNCSDQICNEVLCSITKYINEAKRINYPNPDIYVVQRLKISLQRLLIPSAAESFMDNYKEIMNGNFQKEILKASTGKVVVDLLRKLAIDNIFNSYDILENEVKGHKIIEEILNELVVNILNLEDFSNCKSYSQKLYHLISDNYRLIFENRKSQIENNYTKGSRDFLREISYIKMQLVTDFVCGMTDSYAYNFYQKIQSIE